MAILALRFFDLVRFDLVLQLRELSEPIHVDPRLIEVLVVRDVD
jgi:hypothetical protein